MQQISITNDNQKGQNPLPGPSPSIKPILANLSMSGFHEGGSPDFHIRLIEKSPRIKATTISALRITWALLCLLT
jgi:hypothetical protein